MELYLEGNPVESDFIDSHLRSLELQAEQFAHDVPRSFLLFFPSGLFLFKGEEETIWVHVNDLENSQILFSFST